MKYLIFFLLTIFQCKAQDCLQVDIVILADLSGSVGGNEPFIKEAIKAFSGQFELSETGVKIGVMTFGSNVRTVCSLTSDSSLLNNGINSLGSATGKTNMYGALMAANSELENKGRFGYRKIIIVISDGVPDYPDVTMMIANELKAKPISIFGIFIDSSLSDSDYMKDLSSVYFESNYLELISTLKKLNICL
jgi:Mg-chelatase subunit ChlD